MVGNALVTLLVVSLFAACTKNGDPPPPPQPSDLRSLESFDPGTNSWTIGTMLDSMAQARSVSGGEVISGLFYVVGGSRIRPTAIFSIVERYNPATNDWTTMAPMSNGREGMATGVLGGMLYAVGGASNVSDVATSEFYNPATNTWSSRASLPQPRFGAVGGVIGGTLYVVGGKSGTTVFGTTYVYDDNLNTWTTGPDMSTPRRQAGGAVIDGKLYVVGGYIASDAVSAVLEVFDPATGWSTLTPMSTARGEVAVAAVDGLLYVVGGNRSSNPATNSVTDVVEIYDPVRDEWTSGVPIPTPRSEAAAGAIGGILYVAGGFPP
jgi:N-acetylneuraminic acid mutarotase